MNMGEMRKMDGSGDTKIIWDPEKREEVESAKKTFDDLLSKKYAAFTVKKGGEKHKRVYKFDKWDEKLILVPQFSGG
jgi:hypothetical protein